MAKYFRCVAYGRDNQWEAICTDLDISVFGSSFNEVKTSLEKAMDMYLERVAELPREEQVALLTRPSPWHVHVKLAWIAFLAWLCRRDHRERRDFTINSHSPAHA